MRSRPTWRTSSATSLQLLNEKLAVVGKLDVTGQKATAESADGSLRATLDLGARTLSPPNPENANLATQAVLRLKSLVDAMFGAKLLDRYVLTNRAAESFWQPREPVVLLSGPPAVSTARHGEDGELPCGLIAMPASPGTPEFIAEVDALRPVPGDRSLQSQAEAPWHPIILEWKADVNTAADGRTPNPDIDPKAPTEYAPEYVTRLFQIPENEPDFSPMKALPKLRDQKYSGRCVMTPTAGTQLDVNLTAFLLKTTLYDCRDRDAEGKPEYLDRLIKWHETKHAPKPPVDAATRVAWSKLQKPFVADGPGKPVLLPIDDLATWYQTKPVSGGPNATFDSLSPKLKAEDPPFVAIQALGRRGKMTVLSQSLGGFNSALMTRRRILQIPIEDPLGEGEPLTTDVATAVDVHHPVSPLAFEIYCPIRLGGLALDKLRLLDTFGQSWQVKLEGAGSLVKCNGLTAPDLPNPDFTYLPPRFAAPLSPEFPLARRALGPGRSRRSRDEQRPGNVAGLRLDPRQSCQRQRDGLRRKGTGSRFDQPPGTMVARAGLPAPVAGAKIANPHLRRMVRRLVVNADASEADAQRSREFLSRLLDVLDGAVETIEPASFAQHEALALLMGRPIAVVRARVDLQLMGQPSISETVNDPTIAGGKAIVLKKSQRWKMFSAQDWEVFAEDWGRFYGCSFQNVKNGSCDFLDPLPLADYERTTHGFEKVFIPVRLGEHQLLNDGLVGYWKETPDGDLDNVFHTPLTPDDLQILKDFDYDKPSPAHPCIRARRPGVADEFGLALADDPQTLTLLMDPRGVVHATCGVLPVSQLEIPSAYYPETLKHIGVTFRVSPWLTDSEQLHAAVPKEAGYEWSWVTKPSGSTWNETGNIVDATEHVHFFRPPQIVEGWLKLTPKPSK